MAFLPPFDPTDFSTSTDITNPYFPLPGGTVNSYSATIIDPESGEEETERNDHFATFETRTIAGVEVRVVRDTAYDEGMLVEDTLDWYGQDDFGNVWYMGEIAVNYNYDDDGNFIGTDFDGSWEADVDGAVPGWIMEVTPVAGDNYFQEKYDGVAVDEGTVVETGLEVTVDSVVYTDVIKILDTSALEPDVGAFKYFAPGIGMIFEEEIVLAEPDDPELIVGLENIRHIDDIAGLPAADAESLAFEGDGSEMTVTFLSEDADVNGAIGAYFFDPVSGVIGEARILFADTEDVPAGDSVTIMVPDGQSLGLFLVADVENLGVELEDYMGGGLFFRNFQTGNVAAIYDGDPDTTYTPGEATINDGLAPLVTDADGNLLPIRAFHSAGNRDGFNFLNQVAGENAIAGDGLGDIEVVRFEDGLASTGDYDGDFDDAFVAVSAAPLSEDELETLLDGIDISRIVGTDGDDRIRGTEDDDQLIGLDGDDRLHGRDGDDIIETGDGDDRAHGGKGDDEISGEDGDDRLHGNQGDDEIDGGEGDDRLFGGSGDDLLEGGEGDDRLHGGGGDDTLLGGEDDDRLIAGGDGARMAGGAGDDRMTGEDGAADTFVFDLIEFGDDRVDGFEDGTDLFEIMTYIGVTEFADIGVAQMGDATVLSFAGGTVTVDGLDAALVDATDFAFV